MRLATAGALLLGLAAVPAAAAPGDAIIVATDDAALLDRPEAGATALLRLGRGHRLIEQERRGTWIRVTVAGVYLPGRDLWIPAEAVREPDAAPPPRRLEVLEDEAVGPPGIVATSIDLVVTGTAARFASDCRLAGRDGRVHHRVMRGDLPATVALQADGVSCLVSKEDAEGRLRAELRVSGAILAYAETTAPFGTVRVMTSSDGSAAGDSFRRFDRIFLLPVPPLRPPPSPPADGPLPPVTPVPPFTQAPVPPFE